MSRKKKRSYIPGGFVIGIDEHNNGFDIKSSNPHYESSLLVAGYFMPDPCRASYGSGMFESKAKARIFNGTLDLEKVLKRARGYLSRNPNFLYTSISKERKEETPLCVLKAQASALLIFEFFLRYHFDPSKTHIMMDQVDTQQHSEYAQSVLDYWLQKADLSMLHRTKIFADDNVVAVKKADMVAYYLAGIHLCGTNPKWPYRNRKVCFDKLEEKALNVLEAREKTRE